MIEIENDRTKSANSSRDVTILEASVANSSIKYNQRKKNTCGQALNCIA